MEKMHNPVSAENTASGKKVTKEQAMQLVAKNITEGKLRQAEILIKRILHASPQDAPALHLLGVIAHKAGNIEIAIKVITQAIAINPKDGQFHTNLGEMYRLTKQLDKAREHAEQAVKLLPNSANAHSNLGIIYYDLKIFDLAKQSQENALKINPKLISALNNMGSIERENKNKELAKQWFSKVLVIKPKHVESMNNLAAVLTESEEPEEAIKILLECFKLDKNYAEAHCNIANAFIMTEQFDKAAIGYKKAIELKPDYPVAYQGLARVHQEKSDLPKALQLAKKAQELSPDTADVYNLLGSLYSESGYPDLANESFEKSLEIDPKSISALLGKGQLLMEHGEIDKAEDSYKLALAIDDENLATRLSLAQLKKVKKGDSNMAKLVEVMSDASTMRETKALPLNFALGKCYDDTKDYVKAFEHYKEGCRLKRKRIQYNPDDNTTKVNNIRNFFTKELIDNSRSDACQSDVPIFILGMPRSGTTLTEQIIASHPDVHGAGELPDLLQLSSRPNGWETVGYPAALRGFTGKEFKALGENYVKGLLERAPEAKHITDKMPANFNCLGLIHLMLPKAKIIHVKRSPVDTCLSGFSRLFNKSQLQSYDLAEMGRYYRDYSDLMTHWKQVLPADSFYEVEYEALVSDAEGQSKALIEYCGLEWDDNCLDFHKHERSIRTASVTQVRQPIYKTSVNRWHAYKDHLGPLFDALGDLAPDIK